MTGYQLSLVSGPEPPDIDRILPRLGQGEPASSLESQQLDFKRVGRTPKESLQILADAAVCFANADGGRIILGIDDRATSWNDVFVGVPLDYSIEMIRRGIFDRTDPSITPLIAERTVNDVRILVLDIPQGVLPHSNSAGTATRRIGRECRPFPPHEQREQMAARGQFDWSAQSTGLPVGDLSRVEIDRLRRLLRAAGKADLARQRDRALLESLRLVAEDGTSTNAAVLLLGEEEDVTDVAPTYGYSYQYRPSPGSEASHRTRGQRPILAAVEVLLDAVLARVQSQPLNVAGGVQLTLSDYPQSAVRELVVNALIHRAYDSNGSVDIEQSPERLTILSPGGLVVGVTPENILTHPSTPRHRLLTETVAQCQLAERTGQGIDRAYREMLRAGKPPPRIEDYGLRVEASLAGGIGNNSFVRFVEALPDEIGADVEVLIALSLLRVSPTITAATLATQIQRGTVEAQEVLERMAAGDDGVIEPTRRTVRKPFPSYGLKNQPLAELARAVAYRRRTLDQADAKIVEHVDEYGHISNKTLQRLFDVNVPTARNMLTDLRDRGLLRKIGDARGGPGVKYGPGPKFPRRKR